MDYSFTPKKLAICYTTFLRDELMFKTLKSILDLYEDNWIILVADQGKPTQEKTDYFKSFTNDINSPNVQYFQLPFDSGLSYSRNFLADTAYQLGCDYSLVTADSIQFTYTMTHLNYVLELFSQMQNCGILGLNLQNRVSWEYDMDLVEGKYFLLKKPALEQDLANGMGKVVLCDIVKNFFLAKTNALVRVRWDNQLKLCEHEDFFWRFKQSSWRVAWTNACDATYIDSKPTEYVKYRNRMYSIYRKVLKDKYGIKGWVKYDKD